MAGTTEAPYVRGVYAIARADPDRVAVVCGGTRTTFGELDRLSNSVAHAVAPYVREPGDRVAVMLNNSMEGFCAWHGVARLGALVVPVSTRLTAPEAAYILGDSGSVLLVHEGSPVAPAAAAEAGVPALEISEAISGGGEDEPPSGDWVATPVTAMQYTSGTTGRPKGILRPPPRPAAEAPPSPFATFWGFGPADVHLMCGPMYHTAPSAYSLMSMTEGGTVVVMPRWDATEALALIQQERVTTSQMVPANFIRILEADWRACDLSSVRKILHAAAPCPVDVKRRIMEVFPPGTVWEYYGASEGIATAISPEEWTTKPGSVGRPFPGISLRIVGENAEELPAGEVGEVYVSMVGSHRFEYHNAPDKTARAWRGDHFTVGDLGYLDSDGYLFLVDRRMDLIISGGVNIYPAEVEAALVEDPEVVDAAVIGLPDERMGHRVHALVELRPGAAADAEALVERTRARLADFKLPRTVEFVDTLPREPNGKIMKVKLREERIAQPPPGS
ncbi:MAG TPA: AMP-binding protein [Acidimicrobiales bacterium]|nr:AMP-binding protein [Acidimicrobiales bacterium]